jgi:hypothetical protein
VNQRNPFPNQFDAEGDGDERADAVQRSDGPGHDPSLSSRNANAS